VPAQPTCEVPNVNVGPTYGGDPDWAVPDAERVANAMELRLTTRVSGDRAGSDNVRGETVSL
jgi:hypothetical protein